MQLHKRDNGDLFITSDAMTLSHGITILKKIKLSCFTLPHISPPTPSAMLPIYLNIMIISLAVKNKLHHIIPV